MSTMAYGWELTAPSVTGGKVYQVAVADNLVIVGWGAKHSPTRQYKVEQHNSHTAAQAVALGVTESKERNGYTLNIAPHAHQIDSPTLVELRRMVGHRGASARLQQAFDMLMTHGSTTA